MEDFGCERKLWDDTNNGKVGGDGAVRETQRVVWSWNHEKVECPSEERAITHFHQIFSAPGRACGFKFKHPIQIESYPEILNEIHRMKDRIRIILLRRRNHLKQAISRQNLERIQRQSGQVLSQLVEDVKMTPLKLDVDRAIDYAHQLEISRRELAEITKPFPHRYMVDYEDLVADNNRVVNEILQFLRIPPIAEELSSFVYKATPDNLQEALFNYDELVAKVGDSELKELL